MHKKIKIVSLILGLLFTVLPHVSLYAKTKENPLTGVINKPKINKISQSMGNVSVKEDEDKTDLMLAIEADNKETVESASFQRRRYKRQR